MNLRRPKFTPGLLVAGGLGAVLVGCGTADMNTAALARMIRARVEVHRGYPVQSVTCPPRAKLGEGVVVRCTATLRGGHVVHLRATQLDDKGTIHLVADEMFADNVEHGIVATLAQRGVGTGRTVCPGHIPVVIGRRFDCVATDRAGGHLGVAVTIVDGDGGFGLRFSRPVHRFAH